MYEFTDFIVEVVGKKIRNRTTKEVVFSAVNTKK